MILDFGHHLILKTELSVPETDFSRHQVKGIAELGPSNYVMLRAVASRLSQKRAWSTTWSSVLKGCSNPGRLVV
jgi:hypothetical protein